MTKQPQFKKIFLGKDLFKLRLPRRDHPAIRGALPAMTAKIQTDALPNIKIKNPKCSFSLWRTTGFDFHF
jgi:hypothetical protein